MDVAFNITATVVLFLTLFFLLSSSTKIREPAGECMSDRRRGYTVYLLHTHNSFPTNQVWKHTEVTTYYFGYRVFQTRPPSGVGQVVERWERVD